MISNCEHEEKVVIGGYKTSVCKACRAENIRTFYASGPLLPTSKRTHPEESPKQRGVIHNFYDCCHYHVGLRSDGGQDD